MTTSLHLKWNRYIIYFIFGKSEKESSNAGKFSAVIKKTDLILTVLLFYSITVILLVRKLKGKKKWKTINSIINTAFITLLRLFIALNYFDYSITYLTTFFHKRVSRNYICIFTIVSCLLLYIFMAVTYLLPSTSH